MNKDATSSNDASTSKELPPAPVELPPSYTASDPWNAAGIQGRPEAQPVNDLSGLRAQVLGTDPYVQMRFKMPADNEQTMRSLCGETT